MRGVRRDHLHVLPITFCYDNCTHCKYYSHAYGGLRSTFLVQPYVAQVLSCCLSGCCCNEDKTKTKIHQVNVGASP
jgi:hypothetical protein